MFFSSLWGLCLLTLARAGITIYGQIPLAQTATGTALYVATTTLAAYNDTYLNPPVVPNPVPAPNFTLSLQRDAAGVGNLSIPHIGGGLWGFSIEMSVINQILGKNSTFIQPPFLNLMANIVERAGAVYIRVGGNTQEHATLVDSIPHQNIIAKATANLDSTTKTPAVLYTLDLFYMCNNISKLTNVKWFYGVPFNDTVNWRLPIVEHGQNILGDNLLGIQAGNEPDFYLDNGHRVGVYNPSNYSDDFGSMLAAVDANSNIPNKNMFIGPSCGGGVGHGWTLEQVWDTGFLDKYVNRMYALSVEHYPNHNCVVMYHTEGDPVIPQDEFPHYLTHQAGKKLIEPYLASTLLAQQYSKPFIMFETNTGSCGGFQGISDSYGAALWALDYGLQMAYSNFTNALLHIGGQNVFYNPFTAPPTNQTTFNEWTVGSIYYSTLVIAEALGKTNTSQVVDLAANGDSDYTPAYGIYEKGVLSKVALFNFVDDKTGASDLTVSITVPNSGVPTSVKVKYLECESVSFKNISWAGQTFGSKFKVDGRLKGDLNVTTINCDTGANVCKIPVRAPGFALVFLQDDPMVSLGQATQTYSTTAYTRLQNTATYNPTELATSNGHSANERARIGSTSYGSTSGAVMLRGAGAMALAAVLGACFVLMVMLK